MTKPDWRGTRSDEGRQAQVVRFLGFGTSAANIDGAERTALWNDHGDARAKPCRSWAVSDPADRI